MSNEELAQVEAIGQLTAQQNVQGTEILRAKASITRIDKVVADNHQAYAQSFEKIEAQFDNLNSSITTLKKTVSDNEKSQAEVNELIKSEVGENKSAIELRGQTVFDHKGNGSAIYTIKTGINWNDQYYDAKFMMGAEVKNGKVVTKIGFSADTFGIFNPSSGKLEPVFFVENGQVFINEAFINQATIEKLLIGSTIKSKNWDPETKKGLMLDFNAGKIIADNADITGKITATSGTFSNVTIKEDCDVRGTFYAENMKGNIVSVTKDIYINKSWFGAQVVELFKVKKRSQKCHVWVQGALNPNEYIPGHVGMNTPNRSAIAYRAPGHMDNRGQCDIYIDGVKQDRPNTYQIDGAPASGMYALNEFVIDLPAGSGDASIGISIPQIGNETTRFIMRARVIVFPSADEVTQ
nr:DUF1983 domain-containing protein [Providencia rettgeri]